MKHSDTQHTLAWLRASFKRMRNKVVDASGESLVETLVAVAVSGLAMLALTMAVSVSTNIIQKSEAMADDYYAATDALISGTQISGGTVGQGVVNITCSAFDGGIATANAIDVTYVSAPMPGTSKTAVAYEQE